MYKTPTPKAADIDRKWHIVDLKGKTLGRAAQTIANVLRGKNKAQFTPHLDCGDFVVVINAKEIELSGNKMSEKMYHRHSGYVGALKSVSAEKMLEQKPEQVIINAVKGMLPNNRLRKVFLSKLKVFPGAEHTHEAQKPEPLEV